MRATIGKTFRLEAAHQLRHHDGKCANLHGHSYRVEVQIAGEIKGPTGQSDEGMVEDFAAVRRAWEPLHRLLDHSNLNDVVPETYHPTTAENVARYLLDALSVQGLDVSAIRLWETEGCWAEVRA
jgi:6-pyruvoyltetrahydropterin/6-carboxytetrahydropterin synthase